MKLLEDQRLRCCEKAGPGEICPDCEEADRAIRAAFFEPVTPPGFVACCADPQLEWIVDDFYQARCTQCDAKHGEK